MLDYWTTVEQQAGLYRRPALVWSVTVPASSLAIDLDQVKDFLNRPREDKFYDAQLTGFVRVAQRAIEQRCQLTLCQTTYVGSTSMLYARTLIKKRPFTAVTEIDYVDPTTGTITAVDPTTYATGFEPQLCGAVYLGDGNAWPCAANRRDAYRITATAGWTPDTIPSDVAQALLMTIANVDHSRGDTGTQSGGRVSVYAMQHPQAFSMVPQEAQALLAPYVLRTV